MRKVLPPMPWAILCLVWCVVSLSAEVHADKKADVRVAIRGLMKNSVVIDINGKQQMLKAGKTSPEGVKLISSTSKEAVIEINGKRHTMGITREQGVRFTEAPPGEFRIPRGNNGHFYTTGQINNRSANFVVDTGASSIALSEVEADRLGLMYKNGERVTVSTATTSDLGYRTNLMAVTVGTITIYNVDAIVLPGKYPEIILLGNSFLNKVNLAVDSGVLILEAKF